MTDDYAAWVQALEQPYSTDSLTPDETKYWVHVGWWAETDHDRNSARAACRKCDFRLERIVCICETRETAGCAHLSSLRELLDHAAREHPDA